MIKTNLLLSIYLIVLLSNIAAKKYSDDEASTGQTVGDLPIQHAFGPGDPFTSRGTITFQNLKSASINTVELSEDDINKLISLAGNDGLYFIRTPTNIGETFSSDGNSTNYVSTFVKACYLYGSGLQETITVAVDYAGNIIGLSIVSPKSNCHEVETPSDSFNSTVQIQNQVTGAVPDLQTFVKKIEQQKADEVSGKGKDNRSFIAKYWMYILPVFLVLMLSSQGEAPAEGGGGGGE